MDSSQDKNLPATERKRQKTREEGQGARSRDLSHLAILGMGSAGIWAFAPTLFEHFQLAISSQLAFNAQTVMEPQTMGARLQSMVTLGAIACIIFSLMTCTASVLSAIGAGGWIFSFKPVTPQWSRLNPIKGFGNLFTKQQLTNVAKMVLMTIILSAVAWSYMSSSFERMPRLVLQPSPVAIAYVAQWMVQGLGLLLLVVFVAAVIDVPLQAFFFSSRLKMSHQEVKQEHKESDGNPETKGQQRKRQRDMANKASIGAVPKADFVVMNPTHYAVALRYDEATMSAPQVISKGADLLALRIRDLAKAHEIPVLQSPMLARALYAHAELDQTIPATLFTAVAQVLAHVYRLKAAMRGEGQMPGELDEPQVPPELDPHHKLAKPAAQGLEQ